ncbi:MAG TPA: DegT/DnrJ/EryC1/StrS family aminotransferase [Actinomycetota bacterium]|nr:DegT/DnrJ/EryC1/StrS family aminotransferase [Actinomycetota bacterium]
MNHIPLVDLGIQHREIEAELAEGMTKVFTETSFILGDEVERFEREFAAFSGVSHCVGVANGTEALELALRAFEIGPGDEVILPANTFVATAVAVARAGATPVLVDCDPEFHLINPEEVARRVTAKTKAIIPVHLFGQLAPMVALAAISERTDTILIEDAAQAHGATQNGRPAGSFGMAAGTSFYPGKNLGAYGDAGAVLTEYAETSERIRQLRNYGSTSKYDHPELGFNSRLDSIQALVLRLKLERLKKWNDLRSQAANYYRDLLNASSDFQLPRSMEGNEHVWHLFVVKTRRRDEVLEYLHKHQVGAGIHYPVPLHLQGAFRQLGHKPGDFPISERLAKEMISLPLFPGITRDQQERVVEVLLGAVAA